MLCDDRAFQLTRWRVHDTTWTPALLCTQRLCGLSAPLACHAPLGLKAVVSAILIIVHCSCCSSPAQCKSSSCGRAPTNHCNMDCELALHSPTVQSFAITTWALTDRFESLHASPFSVPPRSLLYRYRNHAAPPNPWGLWAMASKSNQQATCESSQTPSNLRCLFRMISACISPTARNPFRTVRTCWAAPNIHAYSTGHATGKPNHGIPAPVHGLLAGNPKEWVTHFTQSPSLVVNPARLKTHIVSGCELLGKR